MCGIAGIILNQAMEPARLKAALLTMNLRQRHRGPDGEDTWISPSGRIGFAHARLSVIDLETGAQPMQDERGNVIVCNGEIYNYLELRVELGVERFRTRSDTEVILRAYERWGEDCVRHLRGMFAFAIWDAERQALFVARDRFGIKPLYYLADGMRFLFASEIKALTPFQEAVETDAQALNDYFCFQFCLGDKTLFRGLRQVAPAHCGYVGSDLRPKLSRYWEVQFDVDWNHTERYFVEQLRELFFDSIRLHLRSDVEVGAYVSGGMDSSLVAAAARRERLDSRFLGFHGRFPEPPGFDESAHAKVLAAEIGISLSETDIGQRDFAADIGDVIYHLDHPVAGPGSFPQYQVSREASRKLKVVLGGQGGDEIFGGYARYLIAYFEQCIKGAIDGTMHSGNFVVTYDSIIPNLVTLREYKPLIQEFWSQGIFDERDRRYFRLINRANTFGGIVRPELLRTEAAFEEFREIYWGENVGRESYFDSMTHFDFKTLLPALLHVEDRVSMAHGLESRVPMLDHRVVELAATIPANIKFQAGELKRLLRVAFGDILPKSIVGRRDKMGFPVPLQQWVKQPGTVRDFVLDTFGSARARERFYLADGFDIEQLIDRQGPFSRNVWAFLCLELWQQRFHDSHVRFEELS